MDYSREDLMEAKRQMDSVLHKTQQVILTLEAKENAQRYKSQITLARRRVKAFEIASALIQQEIENEQV